MADRHMRAAWNVARIGSSCGYGWRDDVVS
jgi:hypothetical protein